MEKMNKTIKINNTERLLFNAPKQDKLWIAYLDKNDIDWINSFSNYKQEVKTAIKRIVTDKIEAQGLFDLLDLNE